MDGIDFEILINLPIKFKLLLLDIFNQMYVSNCYPDGWKNSFVHFIPKSDGKNLCPISLTFCVFKLFETMVKSRLQFWVETNNIIPESQNGFRKGHSLRNRDFLRFLDLKIIIDQHRHIITNWYRKPTFSGRYLNYNSHHPLSNKIAIIYCLVDRAINLSHSSFHNDNILFIKNVLKLNDYPKKVIDFHLKKRLKNLTFSNSRKTKTFNNKAIISLPYVKELELFNHHFFKQVSTKVLYSTKNKLSSIIKLGKDKTDKVNQAKLYIRLIVKIVTHLMSDKLVDAYKSELKNTQKNIRIKIKNSGLFMHTHDNNHTIDFQNIKILDNEINNGKRLFPEDLFIHSQTKFMNKQFEITRLPSDYNTFIKNCDFSAPT